MVIGVSNILLSRPWEEGALLMLIVSSTGQLAGVMLIRHVAYVPELACPPLPPPAILTLQPSSQDSIHTVPSPSRPARIQSTQHWTD